MRMVMIISMGMIMGMGVAMGKRMGVMRAVVPVVMGVGVFMLVRLDLAVIGPTDGAQRLFQNSIGDLHAVDCLIEQVRQFLAPFLPGQFRPFMKVFPVMIAVFDPMGEKDPQFVQKGFLFHFSLSFSGVAWD